VEKIVIIVAGGSGTRMKSVIPKQFLKIGAYPILMHTAHAFYRYDSHLRIIIVLPANQLDTWHELCKEHDFKVKHEIGIGGETRFHSVQKNLTGIPDHSLVAVHDGVRPLVSPDTIARCFDGARQNGNAVPAIAIRDTIRRIEGAESWQVDRTQYRLIQTPQVFTGRILKQAYLQEYQVEFTDDAGVVECLGQTIYLVEGNDENIKITSAKDLVIATALMKEMNNT
jgi:2-C-methyl-D-erythritol 4-phosphate cytidylyltransferase